MKSMVLQNWIYALRSGTYKQGKNYLKQTKSNRTSYCCLGVLCDLAIKDGVKLELSKEVDKHHNSQYTVFDETETCLPKKVREWADLNDHELMTKLVSYNDNLGFSFDQIAEIIPVLIEHAEYKKQQDKIAMIRSIVI
jgi:hypothetical protein